MNKRFLLVDNINNIQKEATCILLFKNNNDDYLIYYLDENNGNIQIFVSKLIKNLEGKFFLTDININDKNKINNIVYNIVIVLPTEVNNNNNVIENFENKYNVKLLLESLNIDSQNYLSNSRVAITSKILVNNCINFYNKHLNNQLNDNQNNDSMQVQMINDMDVPALPIEGNNILDNSNTLPTNNDNLQVNNPNLVNELPNVNPQMQIIENIESNAPVVSVSNNDNNNINNNDNNNDNEGFVINTAIVVGTIALLLAVTIVTFTFITIKKMII